MCNKFEEIFQAFLPILYNTCIFSVTTGVDVGVGIISCGTSVGAVITGSVAAGVTGVSIVVVAVVFSGCSTTVSIGAD